MSSERKRLVIVGDASIVSMVANAAPVDAFDVRTLAVSRKEDQSFDLTALDVFPSAEWLAFAAIGSDLLNLSRLGLMSSVRGRGHKMAAIVSPHAAVPAAWRPAENVFVDAHAVLGDGATLRHNVFVGARAVVGRETTIGHSVWIGAGAIVGAEVTIGDGTIIAPGVILADNVKVGRQCALERAGLYHENVADGSFHSPLFDDVVQLQPRQNTT